MRDYFYQIYQALFSITEGMAVTMSYLFRRPSTIQYPNKLESLLENQMPDRFRGILQVDISICIGCRLCEKTCPIDCIAIDIEKNKETKERFLTWFAIDISKCMYCGLCSENCSTTAIYHTKVFNGATREIDNLIVQFVSEPMKLVKAKKKDGLEETSKDLHGKILKEKMPTPNRDQTRKALIEKILG